MARCAGLAIGVLLVAHVAGAQFIHQGSKLVGTGALYAEQGWSVAISADGNTAIVGGPEESFGAAWVFTRSAEVWTQQGAKLVGTENLAAGQGRSVAISADGDTAIVGGPFDSNDAGAAWVFCRRGVVWSQQGSKLVGAGAVGKARQGSVAISADGDTAIVGGSGDNSNAGAAWVFTRSGGAWSQQGSKLVGTGAVGGAGQGASVAISGDGNTAIVGGPGDKRYGNSSVGAVWVFTRRRGAWAQQGSKLVGTGAVGGAGQGASVAISGDGNTAIVGGPGDGDNGNFSVGAVWLFARRRGAWAQQGSKLVGRGGVDPALQGRSVAISADGNTAIVGGQGGGDSGAGTAWVFKRSGVVWSQHGSRLAGSSANISGDMAFPQDTWVAISGDGNTAIVGQPEDNSDVGAALVFVESRTAAPSITAKPQSQSSKAAKPPRSR